MSVPFTSYLHEYMYKCRNGEILAGQELLQTFDILDEHLENPDIRFEVADANKRISFIEEKCRHFEAPYAGKPFILDLFQKAFVTALHAFKIYEPEIDKWVRLFQDVLFLVGRKNGKTPLIGALNLSEFFCGPEGIKILCSSNDYEQAALMFDAINAMREESPSLEKVTRKNLTGIYFGNPKRRKNKGKFSYRNKGHIKKISAKTGAKEGRNIAVGAADEVHEMKDNSGVMPIRQSLSTQDEPLYYELTTEGFTNDGYLDGRMIEARQVLNRELHRPRWLIWLYTQDSEQEIWQDERTWVKSNPGLGSIKKWSFLRGMVEESKTNKATRIFVLAKDFNIKQNNAAAWLTADEITNAEDESFEMEKLRGRIALGGVDLSKSGDLACARALFLIAGKKHTVSQYFIPESKLAQLPKDLLEKYKGWIRQGRMTVCDGNENDFRLVTAWFIRLVKDYGIRFLKIGYDKWSAVYWVKEMEEAGFDMERVKQDWAPMSEPMKLVEADLRSNLIFYNNDSLDKWCLENTAIAVNEKMHQMPIKVQGKEEQKIDGAVTLIICYRMYIDNRSDFLRLSA